MLPQSFIFIGRSGSGKGTQAQLLIEYLESIDPSRKSLYIQTGALLRDFIEGPTLTQKVAKDIYDAGGLMPEFTAIYQWVKALIERYNGNEHLIFDGTPRKLHEAGVLNSIFSFYKLTKPWVIHIDVTPEEALKRLMLRKRMDDTEADIKERLSWFETEVVPAIDYYKKSSGYTFLSIKGERSVLDIHADIVQRLALK